MSARKGKGMKSARADQFLIQGGILKGYREDPRVTDVFIPDGVTRIDNDSFRNCTSVVRVHMPDSVTIIGVEAFSGCTGLETVDFSQGLRDILPRAFMNCTKLARLSFPENLGSIGEFAFGGCSGLVELDLPDKLDYVADHAFHACSSLTNVRLSPYLELDMEQVFDGTPYLEKACLSPDDTDQVPSESDRSEDDMPEESDAGCDGLDTRAMLDVVRNHVPGLSKADVMKRLSEEERDDEYSRMADNLIALMLACNIPAVKYVELPVWACVVSAANGDEDFQFPHWFRESEKAALLRLARHGNIPQSPAISKLYADARAEGLEEKLYRYLSECHFSGNAFNEKYIASINEILSAISKNYLAAPPVYAAALSQVMALILCTVKAKFDMDAGRIYGNELVKTLSCSDGSVEIVHCCGNALFSEDELVRWCIAHGSEDVKLFVMQDLLQRMQPLPQTIDGVSVRTFQLTSLEQKLRRELNLYPIVATCPVPVPGTDLLAMREVEFYAGNKPCVALVLIDDEMQAEKLNIVRGRVVSASRHGRDAVDKALTITCGMPLRIRERVLSDGRILPEGRLPEESYPMADYAYGLFLWVYWQEDGKLDVEAMRRDLQSLRLSTGLKGERLMEPWLKLIVDKWHSVQSIPQDPDELFSPLGEKDCSLLFGILPEMIDEDIINDDGCASTAGQLEQYLSHPSAISFSGRKFVFSGVEEACYGNGERPPVIRAVEKRGGLYRKSVSGATDYLVIDPAKAGKNKLKAALEQKKKGNPIQIILLSELQAILEGSVPSSVQKPAESVVSPDGGPDASTLAKNMEDLGTKLEETLDDMKKQIEIYKGILQRQEDDEKLRASERHARIAEAGKGADGSKDELLMYANLEVLKLLHAKPLKDDDFAESFAEDFPLLDARGILKLRNAVRKALRQPDAETAYFQRLMEQPVTFRTKLLFNAAMLNDQSNSDPEERFETARRITANWFRPDEAGEVEETLQKARASLREEIVRQMNNVEPGWCDYQTAKPCLRVSVQTSGPDERKQRLETALCAEYRDTVCTVNLFKGNHFGFSTPVQTLFVWLWDQTSEKVWEDALGTCVSDDRADDKKTVPLDEIEQAVRRLVLKQTGASSPENSDQKKSSAGGSVGQSSEELQRLRARMRELTAELDRLSGIGGLFRGRRKREIRAEMDSLSEKIKQLENTK